MENPPTPAPAGEAVVVTRRLTKRYGDTAALDGLDLDVPPGCIFGYLGANGAGKTTTIRLLLDLLRPSSGSVQVFGLDPARHRREVLRRVGYLPGDFAADKGLTAGQYLDYVANLRGGVDRHEIELLAKRFELGLDRRIGALSHGNRQKVGIIQACMHHPDLLVLDEPTSGLDPIMQHEFLQLLREQRDRGGTVFLSSHVLTEVEEVADLIGVIRRGHLVTVTSVADLKRRTRRRVDLTFAPGVEPPIVALTRTANVRDVEQLEGAVRVEVEGSMSDLFRVAAPYGIERAVSNEVDLEEMFLRYYEEA
jgi:ABC-2 type transport system ATP-binding protein